MLRKTSVACIRDKEKLLFIVNSTLIGGHEVQAKYIVKDLLNAGIDVVIVCPNETVRDFFIETGAVVLLVPFDVNGKLWKQIATRRRTEMLMAPYLFEYREVMVSGGSIEAVINPVMAIKSINPKVHVVSYVPMYIDRSITHGWVGKIYNLLLDVLAKVTDEYLTVNRIQASIIKKRTGISANYIFNRVRPVQVPKQTFGPRLLYVGRFDNKQKDITGLLNLLDDPRNPYKKIILIGDGPDRKLILHAAKCVRHLTVEIMGWLDSNQIDDLAGTEDVLVLNSRWEGEPLVVREFLEKGLTCIARDIPGTRGIVGKKFRFQSRDELLAILSVTYQRPSINTKRIE